MPTLLLLETGFRQAREGGACTGGALESAFVASHRSWRAPSQDV